MLSDYEATQVMFFISCHDQSNPVVKHLYELHKLRDAEVFYDTEDTLSFSDPLYKTFCELHNGSWEADDA